MYLKIPQVWVSESPERILGYANIVLFALVKFQFLTQFPVIFYHFTPLRIFSTNVGFSQEFKWQQVSSSLQDLSRYSGRSVVCMVSTCLLIFKSFCLCTLTTIGITVTFQFHIIIIIWNDTTLWKLWILHRNIDKQNY